MEFPDVEFCSLFLFHLSLILLHKSALLFFGGHFVKCDTQVKTASVVFTQMAV